jgi:Tol biopolymer transport system component
MIIEVGKAWEQQTPDELPPMTSPDAWFEPWSWSPDGQKLVGNSQRADGSAPGMLVYSLATRQYEKLADTGTGPVWLSDNRRVLYINQGKLYLMDTQSKKSHEVLSVAPYAADRHCLSKDDRTIYFTLTATEADIWLMTVEEGERSR